MAEIGEPLSDRELAVLESLVDGSTNREIAQNLHISHNTVKVHLRNIFTKLDVSSRTEATAVALQMGLLSLPGLESTAETEEEQTAEPSIQEGTEVPEVQTEPAAHTVSPAVFGPRTEPSHRWRNISLGLGGLLLVALLVFVALQFLGNDDSEANNGEAIQFEVPIGDTRWFNAPPSPRPISNMALAAVGLNLYQIGGEVEAGVVNLVDIYETDTGRWMSGASKPTAVADVTAAVLFGEIYVPGGRLADGQPTSVVEAYSPANNAWRPVAPLPTPVSGGLAISDGSQLYFFGGWDGTDYQNDVLIYNSSTNVWTSTTPMSVGRSLATGGILAGEIFVVGGQNSQGELADCESFEPVGAVWTPCPDMNSPRAGAGSAVLSNNLLYIIGGGLETPTLQSDVYDSAFMTWRTVEMPTLTADSWTNLAVAHIETRIFIFGGRQGDSILDGGYVFSPFVHQTFLPAVGADE
jgi:DNA-binding CsgD family transcriptional regulator/N-acetylneuraminic acid mutarotase